MLTLIPQPQRHKELPGQFVLPGREDVDFPGTLQVGLASADIEPQVEQVAACLGYCRLMPEYAHLIKLDRQHSIEDSLLGMYSLRPAAEAEQCHVVLRQAALAAEQYRLSITPERITITAGSAAGFLHAGHTLLQLRLQFPYGELPCVEIDDWPDFAARGLYYDISRGRVPHSDKLCLLPLQLRAYKLNQLQLYVEHTFAFHHHPAIGAGASPLTAQHIMRLDDLCASSGIELVPSLATFGHMSRVLSLPAYRHLAEDWGEGRYLDPQATAPEWGRGWSLAPANPESYRFLAQLFDEFLPCFSSRRFNVCCDETYDLGWGQSYALAQQIGKGRLYLGHLLKLRELAAAHGKEIMYWGDIIRSYPELIPELPREAAVLDWGYEARMDFDRIRDFTATGLSAYACPTVSGYVSLFPRLHESMGNIAGWARAGKAHGAAGLLNTDWGDGGHYNFTQCAWPGYLCGAELAWNSSADTASFLARFCRLFLNIDSGAFTHALARLGDVAQTHVRGYYQSFWRHVFFARPGDAVLTPTPRPAAFSTLGELHDGELRPDAAYGVATHDTLEQISAAFQPYIGYGGAGWSGGSYDPHEVLDYWQFSVDTLKHAARKLAALGEGGHDTPSSRCELRDELGALRERFVELWQRSNRPGGIEITLALYDNALAGLE